MKCSVAGQNMAPPRWDESNQMRNKEKQTQLGEVLNKLMVSVQHFVNKLTLLQRMIHLKKSKINITYDCCKVVVR